MKIVVTELTYMGQSVCVAGWDTASARMVRPLFRDGRHWDLNDIEADEIEIGTVIDFEITKGANSYSEHPHKANDVYFDEYDLPGSLPWKEDKIHQVLKPTFMDNPASYFKFKYGAQYTMPGTRAPSLGAMRILAKNVEFYEKPYQSGSPRLRFKFSSNFPVTGIRLRDTWKEHGCEELNKFFGKYKYLHLQLGLARPWNNRCYCQLNNILYTEAE